VPSRCRNSSLGAAPWVKRLSRIRWRLCPPRITSSQSGSILWREEKENTLLKAWASSRPADPVYQLATPEFSAFSGRHIPAPMMSTLRGEDDSREAILKTQSLRRSGNGEVKPHVEESKGLRSAFNVLWLTKASGCHPAEDTVVQLTPWNPTVFFQYGPGQSFFYPPLFRASIPSPPPCQHCAKPSSKPVICDERKNVTSENRQVMHAVSQPEFTKSSVY
jgi:hypothetical protein